MLRNMSLGRRADGTLRQPRAARPIEHRQEPWRPPGERLRDAERSPRTPPPQLAEAGSRRRVIPRLDCCPRFGGQELRLETIHLPIQQRELIEPVQQRRSQLLKYIKNSAEHAHVVRGQALVRAPITSERAIVASEHKTRSGCAQPIVIVLVR